jgi:alpha-tubulin suppressor-like RCC1 family protein
MRGCLQDKTIVDIAAGLYHSLALTSDGVVCAWGSNYFGELGYGSFNQYFIPVAVKIPDIQVNRVFAGYHHSIITTCKFNVHN